MKKLLVLVAATLLVSGNVNAANVIQGKWSDGTYPAVAVDEQGRLRVVDEAGSGFPASFSVNNFPTGFLVNNFPTTFTVDNAQLVTTTKAPVDVDWLPAAARTAGVTGSDITNTGGEVGISVSCNVTTVPGLQSLQVKVQGKNTFTGVYYDVVASSPTVVSGNIVVKILPVVQGVVASITGAVSSDRLPVAYRLQTVHSGGGSWNYNCAYTKFY